MLEEVSGQHRPRAGKSVAKRRRMNGSLEGAPALGEPAPPGFDGPGADPSAPDAGAADRTEILDAAVLRLPPPQLNAAELPVEQVPRKASPPEAIPIGNAAVAASEATPLELRIRRLEDALAQLQLRRAAEQRVTAQPGRPAIPVATADPNPPDRAPTDKLWDLGKRVLTSPVEAARTLSSAPDSPRARRAWLFFETVTEARAIYRMFTDPRYRLSWTGRIGPPLLTLMITVSWWWLPLSSIAVVGTLLNKAVDLLLAFVLFKLLGHEARRYRETAPDLPPSLRL
jgi:hypothetical protein